MGEAALAGVHARLLRELGPQGWWPADGPEEVVVGAVLVQAVAWRNAEAALHALRGAGLLELRALAAADPDRLVPLIRPAGYYRAKARTLQGLAAWIAGSGGLPALRAAPAAEVRRGLLRVRGVGPETADAILCYALGQPALLADAYTRRILGRMGLLPAEVAGDYERARAALQVHLPPHAPAPWLGELHALFVAAGKAWCRPRDPRCGGCPLRPACRLARDPGAPGMAGAGDGEIAAGMPGTVPAAGGGRGG
jgi:endonuclease-3 related protein